MLTHTTSILILKDRINGTKCVSEKAKMPESAATTGSLRARPNQPRSGFSGGTAAALRRLFEVLTLLDLFGQAFLLAQFFKPAHHLLHAFASSGLDSNRHG
jgi:hypothetical protein